MSKQDLMNKSYFALSFTQEYTQQELTEMIEGLQELVNQNDADAHLNLGAFYY